jgi:hypothetical protein
MGEGMGEGGKMTQTLYAYMNNIKEFLKNGWLKILLGNVVICLQKTETRSMFITLY